MFSLGDKLDDGRCLDGIRAPTQGGAAWQRRRRRQRRAGGRILCGMLRAAAKFGEDWRAFAQRCIGFLEAVQLFTQRVSQRGAQAALVVRQLTVDATANTDELSLDP